jgi:glycosyltransferase involved in cell wall biosynthesis
MSPDAAPRQTVVDNADWPTARPILSILTPFFHDDPTPLLAALEMEGAAGDGAVELVLLDDGSRDDALIEKVTDAINRSAIPSRLVVLERNMGRAIGRNRLAAEARGQWLLFLDSDMLPDSRQFLGAYLGLIQETAPAVAFGGFSVNQTPARPEHALHRYMTLASDCAPAKERALEPEKHVFTSNLLVRRDVFDSEAFDEGFTGWGWEDVEWAMRVVARYEITHLDNTATHLGLDTAPAMAVKFEQSARNFARVVTRHREIVSAYPSYRVARALKAAPLKGVWRPWLKGLGLADWAPLRLRDFALRLYRAALYADVV